MQISSTSRRKPEIINAILLDVSNDSFVQLLESVRKREVPLKEDYFERKLFFFFVSCSSLLTASI
jgi:hypothetical protein